MTYMRCEFVLKYLEGGVICLYTAVAMKFPWEMKDNKFC